MSAARETTLKELRSMRERLDALIKLLEGDGGAQPATGPGAGQFVGVAMRSKYAGKCHVCGEPYKIDDSIVYSGTLKKAAHVGCGRPEPRNGARS